MTLDVTQRLILTCHCDKYLTACGCRNITHASAAPSLRPAHRSWSLKPNRSTDVQGRNTPEQKRRNQITSTLDLHRSSGPSRNVCSYSVNEKRVTSATYLTSKHQRQSVVGAGNFAVAQHRRAVRAFDYGTHSCEKAFKLLQLRASTEEDERKESSGRTKQGS